MNPHRAKTIIAIAIAVRLHESDELTWEKLITLLGDLNKRQGLDALETFILLEDEEKEAIEKFFDVLSGLSFKQIDLPDIEDIGNITVILQTVGVLGYNSGGDGSLVDHRAFEAYIREPDVKTLWEAIQLLPDEYIEGFSMYWGTLG